MKYFWNATFLHCLYFGAIHIVDFNGQIYLMPFINKVGEETVYLAIPLSGEVYNKLVSGEIDFHTAYRSAQTALLLQEGPETCKTTILSQGEWPWDCLMKAGYYFPKESE